MSAAKVEAETRVQETHVGLRGGATQQEPLTRFSALRLLQEPVYRAARDARLARNLRGPNSILCHPLDALAIETRLATRVHTAALGQGDALPGRYAPPEHDGSGADRIVLLLATAAARTGSVWRVSSCARCPQGLDGSCSFAATQVLDPTRGL